MTVSLVAPFPPAHVPILWSWMSEHKTSNFDDGGPKSALDLGAMLQQRAQDGEHQWEVRVDGVPVGFIGYRQLDPTLGAFRGIVFTSSVHGSGVARNAVSQALQGAFAGTTKRVRAEYFANNRRIERLLEKLGGKVIGYIPCGSMQNGIPIDWKALEIAADDYGFASLE